MSPNPRRAQRVSELRQARDRLTAQIVALDPYAEIDLPPAVAPSATGERLSALARHMVHTGSTHAQVADALHIPASAVTHLIAPRRTA